MKITPSRLIMTTLLASLVACNQGLPGLEDKDEAKESAIDDDNGQERPEDSTGASGTVKVEFKTQLGSLGLVDETDPVDEPAADAGTDPAAEPAEDPATASEPESAGPLAVADGISVTTARFNIGMLKLKTKKDPTPEDEENDRADVDDDREQAGEIESEDDAAQEPSEDGISLAKGPREKEDEHRRELAEERDHHKGKERELEEREKSRDGMTRILGLIYDAVTGLFEGDQPTVDVADGSYRRIEFKLRRNLSVAEDDALLGKVFVIQGTVTVGEASVPFEIADHRAMNFRIRADRPFEVAAGGDNPLTVVFDVSKWFEGIDLAGAEVGVDGVIRLNRHENRDLFREFRRNMKFATKCGRDKNGDGSLGEEEAVGSADPDTLDDAD